MYEVILAPDASRVYARAEIALARKLKRCFAILSEEPHVHPCIKRLAGAHRNRWRYRVGDWRVIYAIDEESRRVLVSAIGHRREVYK
jgi:mRNA interferase RelE/StbE